MQKFLLIHNGSNQAWQTAYLAFHVSGSLGAPLMVVISGLSEDKDHQNFNAKQVEIAGRAAGVAIQTIESKKPIINFLADNTEKIDGLFLPRKLIPDMEVLSQYLKLVACPIWVVNQDAEHDEMAIIINKTFIMKSFVDYAVKLASRLQHNLTGLIQNSESGFSRLSDYDINWYAMTDFSFEEIAIALNRLGANLLFIDGKNASFLDDFQINFVVFPTS
jgi:hypothetical protein